MNRIKKVNKKDFFEIIKINEEAIPAVNSITESEFEWFFKHALYFKKVLNLDKIIGFLLVLPSKLNYRSLNYQWFSNHYSKFAYIDRIVIIQGHKNNGIGTSLYLSPVLIKIFTKSLADPSSIGISWESTSTIALSIPNPKKAAIRCSIVETLTPYSFDIVVQSVASLTFSKYGITILFFFKSVLLKMIPEFGDEGKILRFTLFPV